MHWLLIFIFVFFLVLIAGVNAEASTVTSSEALLGSPAGLVYVGGFAMVIGCVVCFWVASKANAEMKNKGPDFMIAQSKKNGHLCFIVHGQTLCHDGMYTWVTLEDYPHFYQALNSRGLKCVSDDCGLTYYLKDGRECSASGRPLKRT